MKPDAPVTKTRIGNLQWSPSPVWPMTEMSVTDITVAQVCQSLSSVQSSYGQMAAGPARSPGKGGDGALRRARLRPDDGGANRRAGRANRADFLPPLRRQAGSVVRGERPAPGPLGPDGRRHARVGRTDRRGGGGHRGPRRGAPGE